MIPKIVNFILFISLVGLLIKYKLLPAFDKITKEIRDKILVLKNKKLEFLKEEENIVKKKDHIKEYFLRREEEESKATKSLKESLEKKIKNYENFLKKDLEERLLFLEQDQEKKFIEAVKEKMLFNVEKKLDQENKQFSKKMVSLYDEIKKDL